MSRIDDAVSRILTAKFELGLFEHPFTDRRNIDTDRQQGAPQGRPAGGGRVAGAAQEPAAHPAAQRREDAAGVRRGQQRRQHRQPGRRLDADLAGRLDQRDPRRRPSSTASRTPRRRRCTFSETATRPGAARTRPVSWSSARRRTPRASATSTVRSGPTTRRPNVPRPEEDDAAQRRRPAAIRRRSARRPPSLHGPGGLRSAADHPAGPARPDRRAGRVVAAGQRGDGRGRRAVRQEVRSPASCR